MNLSSIIDRIPQCNKVELVIDDEKSLHYSKKRFYVFPSINDVTKTRTKKLNPKFIIFSAPGATGKSALAEYIAYTKNGFYWDLSSFPLGYNTFIGTVMRSIGTERFSSFINSLKKGNAIIIIDSFDEAEMACGREQVDNLLLDINNVIDEYISPTVFLFARTETSNYLENFCYSNSIAVIHYEIDFFEESNAKNFIIELLKFKSVKITQPVTLCVEKFFNTMHSIINKDELQSFIGYAPVLETVAILILNNKNYSKLIHSLNNENNGVDIVISILQDLLAREREKIVKQFKGKCQDKVNFSDWGKIYTEEEQLVRIINYIIFGKIQYNDYPIQNLPSEIVSDYIEIISPILPQHPFLQQNIDDEKYNFTGPAFCDYSNAKLLTSGYDDEVEIYFENQTAALNFPSQMFFDFYCNLSKANIVSGKHMLYLYESFSTKSTSQKTAYFDLASDSNEVTASFRLGNTDENETTLHGYDVSDIGLNQLSNSTIDVDTKIIFGTMLKNVRIYNSIIIAKQIEFKSEKVLIESYDNNIVSIVCEEPIITLKTYSLFELLGDGVKQFDIPNIEAYYPLNQYKYNYEDASSFDITRFIYNMRRIFVHFRAHRKDNPGKYIEKIDNRVLANNTSSRAIFDFLSSQGVFTKEPPIYILHLEKLHQLGIYREALTNNDQNQLRTVYMNFLKWIEENSIID